jgi:hypothetical protein
MQYWDPIGPSGLHPGPRDSAPLWILIVLEQPLAAPSMPSDAGALGGRESRGEACDDGT